MASYSDTENEVEIMSADDETCNDAVEPTESRLLGKVVDKVRQRIDPDTMTPVGEFTMTLDFPHKDFGELTVEVRGEQLVNFVTEKFIQGARVLADGQPYVLSEPTQPPVLRCNSTSIGIIE